ncbi:MAG TPA: BrnT family toxin [Methylomirabilota bacterium]
MQVHFEWDPDKAAKNLRIHEVSFEEASTIFSDPLASEVRDIGHSEHEDRWLTVGMSRNGRF